MKLENFHHPISTQYKNGDMGLKVVYSPELVKTLLTEAQINQILDGYTTKDKSKLPTNALFDVSTHIISTNSEFMKYEIYRGVFEYNDHELVYETTYNPDLMQITLHINVKKYGPIKEYVWA